MAMMGGGFGPQMMRSLRRDSSVTKERLTPGNGPAHRPIRPALLTAHRGLPGAGRGRLGHRDRQPAADEGDHRRRDHPASGGVVIALALVIAGLAVVDAALALAQRWFSARIGEGLIYDLRTEVFDHVQRMPVAFFMRAQTGALVSRLNSDVIGAQRALTEHAVLGRRQRRSC